MTEVQFAKQFLTTLDSKTSKYQSSHVFDPKTFQLRIPYTLPKLPHPPHPLPPKSKPVSAPAPGSEPISQPTPTINITLKSSRNPNFTLHLPLLPPSTPIATLKIQVQSLFSGSVPTEKIKILYNKKPTPASQSTVHDVLSSAAQEGSGEVEFGVMIMGGAPDPTPNVQTVNLANAVESSVPAPGPGSENAAVEAAIGINPEDAMKNVQPSTSATVQGATNVLENTKRQQEESIPVQPGEVSGKDVLKTEEFWVDLQGFLEQRLRDADEAGRLVEVFKQVSR